MTSIELSSATCTSTRRALHHNGVRLAVFAAALAVLIGAAGWPMQAAAQAAVQRIAAVVNSDIISNRDVSSRVGLAILISGLNDDTETRQRLVPQVLRGLIDERLQLQAASRLGLSVTEGEVASAYNDVAQRNNMNPAQLTDFLRQRGVDAQLVRDQLRAQVAWLKVVGRELRSRVVVTNDQVELALRASRAGDVELLLSEIVLPVYEGDDELAIEKQAQDLVRSIREGAEFAGLARQLSSAPSAEAGGDLGWVRLSAMSPEIRPAVADLRPNQIAQPVRTQAGLHILEVRDRRQLSASSAEPTTAERDGIKQRLQQEQLQRLAARYLRDLRRNAFIDVRL